MQMCRHGQHRPIPVRAGAVHHGWRCSKASVHLSDRVDRGHARRRADDVRIHLPRVASSCFSRRSINARGPGRPTAENPGAWREEPSFSTLNSDGGRPPRPFGRPPMTAMLLQQRRKERPLFVRWVRRVQAAVLRHGSSLKRTCIAGRYAFPPHPAGPCHSEDWPQRRVGVWARMLAELQRQADEGGELRGWSCKHPGPADSRPQLRNQLRYDWSRRWLVPPGTTSPWRRRAKGPPAADRGRTGRGATCRAGKPGR